MIGKRKAFVFIDGGNFYKQLKDTTGNPSISFDKLRKWIANKFNIDVVRVYYYNAIVDQSSPAFEAQKRFLDAVRHQNHYSVELGKIVQNDAGVWVEKCVDTNICCDMVSFAADKVVDVFVLVTGDLDMLPAVKKSKDYGTVVFVLSFKKFCSSELENSADMFLPLHPTMLSNM